MSNQIPKTTVDIFRSFNDLALDQFGINCTLYIPTNQTTVEGYDMYSVPENDLTWKTYEDQKVWVTWHETNVHRLRKLGIFGENEHPILARFKNNPEITINSYIKVDNRYIPDDYDVDEFEITDILMSNMYENEIYRFCKLNPRRTQ